MPDDSIKNVPASKAKSHSHLNLAVSGGEPILEPEVENDRPKKLPLALIEEQLIDWMDWKPGDRVPLEFAPKMKEFNNPFCVFVSEDEVPQILRYNTKTATYSLVYAENPVASAIRKAFTRCPKAAELYRLGFMQTLRVARRWVDDTVRKLDEWPRAMAFKSEVHVRAFNRLNFDPIFDYVPTVNFPRLNKTFSNAQMKGATAFVAKIGQMFTPGAPRIQVVWLCGAGGTGKSTLMDLIEYLCGGTAGVARKGSYGVKGKHWKKPLIKKKLVIFNEAEPEFLASKEFLALTGEDIHEIEPKGKDAYTAKLDCHAMFTSNDMPTIPNKIEIKRRLLVCELLPFQESEHIQRSELDGILQAELPWFIAYCMDTYKRVNVNGHIPNETDELLNTAISEHDEHLQYVFDECFELVPATDIDPFKNLGSFITAHQFESTIQEHIDPRKRISVQSLRKFLKDTYNIVGTRTRLNGEKNQTRIYMGIRLKTKILPPMAICP